MNKLEKKEYDKKYYKDNKEKCLEQTKIYYQKHKKYYNEYHIKYHQDNLEEEKKRINKYYQDNKEYILERSKKHHQENLKYYREYNKKYREQNKEMELERNRKWMKTDKGKACHQRGHTARRVREREIINTLTSQEWLDILEEYNYRCAYCEIEFDYENLPTKDHIIPLSKGGNNIKENITPACRSCNSKKHNKIIKKKEMAIC